MTESKYDGSLTQMKRGLANHLYSLLSKLIPKTLGKISLNITPLEGKFSWTVIALTTKFKSFKDDSIISGGY